MQQIPGPRSKKLFQSAQSVIPGGVNSPVRAFRAVGGQPLFIKSAAGAMVTDADDQCYIDYVMSWGPMIFGHACEAVTTAARRACAHGMSFGMPTEAELRLAELLVQCFPGMEKVRMVNSGTEAAMSAIRLARGYTGRDLILKFEGGYHGHADGLLAAAGSGLATFAIPDSSGVPAAYTEKTLIAPYNNLEAVQQICQQHGPNIAGIILEPVAGNMGVVPPEKGFLPGLRTLADQYGLLLIFDEVITGLRLGLSGAQGLYQVQPDITVLGKIIGGGMPCAAYGGSARIMDKLAPDGPVYQAGTLSGNPVAMEAGYAVLEKLLFDPPYARLEILGAQLADALGDAARQAGVPVTQNRVGSMQTLFFTEHPVTDYQSAKTADTAKYARFFHEMLQRGVHFAPSQFEAAFVSTAHTEGIIEKTAEAARQAMKALA